MFSASLYVGMTKHTLDREGRSPVPAQITAAPSSRFAPERVPMTRCKVPVRSRMLRRGLYPPGPFPRHRSDSRRITSYSGGPRDVRYGRADGRNQICGDFNSTPQHTSAIGIGAWRERLRGAMRHDSAGLHGGRQSYRGSSLGVRAVGRVQCQGAHCDQAPCSTTRTRESRSVRVVRSCSG